LGVAWPLVNGYGQSENGPMTLLGRNGSYNWMLPIYSTDHRLIDDLGNEIDGDGIGLNQTYSPAHMLNYHGNPEDTAKYFIGDTFWTDVGDVVERKTMDDGLEWQDVLGRDSILNSYLAKNGKRVHGVIVDNFLMEIENVSAVQTVALPVKDKDETHILTVHIVLKKSFGGDKDKFLREIILKCQDELDTPMVPAGYKFRDSMPQNETLHKRDVAMMASDYDDYYDLVDGELVKTSFR
jgi:acyl-coenzyme A synthetase/AMP-(fatty) acid ligase